MKSKVCTKKWAKAEQIPTTEPKCPLAYYDTGGQIYWIQDLYGEWIRINEKSLDRHLRAHGFSRTQGEGQLLSPLEKCINNLQRKSNVAYAGPLAGYRKGLREMCGRRILVTSSPKLITPAQRPYPTLQRLLINMFGGEQLTYFKGWLKIACESIAIDITRAGQVLVMAGPRDSYKSFLQNLITEFLGGRSAKPYRYMSGATEFNGDLFGAEHLMIEDDIASCDIRSRRNFGARIKEFTVNDVQSCHAKNRQALSLKPFWRLTISVNDEPENLMILPPLDDSLADKIIMLKVSKQPPLMPTVAHEDRQKFMQTLSEELPGFLWDLLRWEIPPEIQSGRFGILHYHHPDLLQALEDSAPETKLLAIIDAAFREKEDVVDKKAGFKGTAEELESILTAAYPAATRRLFTWSDSVGTYLGRLADKHPERVERCRTAGERLWKVNPPRHKQVQSRVATVESEAKDNSLCPTRINGLTTIPSAGDLNGRVSRFQKVKAYNNNGEQLTATEGKTSPIGSESASEPPEE